MHDRVRRRTWRKRPIHHNCQPAVKRHMTPAGVVISEDTICGYARVRHMKDRVGLAQQVNIALDTECQACLRAPL